jgi:GTP-binding protein
LKYQEVKFVKSVVAADDLPLSSFPEVALIGRSNVGKSSLLNHFFGLNIAKVSSTPGKTRALNFFNVDGHYFFVDLPGYGYAAVSKQESHRWAKLIEHYLCERRSLKLLLFLLDIRREPSPDDMQMLAWIEHNKLEAILILTKVDKVTHAEKSRQTKRITDRIKGLPYVHYSATKNEGRKELMSLLRERLF